VTLRRGYFTCRRCGVHSHPLDDRLGVDGLVSPHAQRLLCVAGAERSFERAARLLHELAGLNICDNTVRAACDCHGGRMRAWRRNDPEASRPFREADGDVEFQTDGTCINTTGGWREVRLSIFAKRRRGEPVLAPEDWDNQRLPSPHVRSATATIGSGEALGPRWRRTARRLGIGRTDDVTVLADGRNGSGTRSLAICREPRACWTSSMPRSTCTRRRSPCAAKAPRLKPGSEPAGRLFYDQEYRPC
jgi:hypothetical protein